MANSYTYGATGALDQRWTSKQETTTTRLNIARAMADHLYEALNTIMSTTAADGILAPTGAVKVAQGEKLYFDTDLDTYIYANGDDQLNMYTGGSNRFYVDNNGAHVQTGSLYVVAGDIQIPATNKLYLDGGGDTYIAETSANIINIYAGGVSGAFVTSGGLGVAPTKQLWLDGGGDTYIYESVANNMAFMVGGSAVMSINNYPGVYVSGYVALAATQKLYLDGVDNTYIYESAADNIAFVTGGSTRFQIGTYGAQVTGSLYTGGGIVYLDADNDTYMRGNPDDYIIFTLGGISQLYMVGDQFNVGYEDNGNGQIYINYNGYAGGATQYRDFYVCNGKNGIMSTWDGSGNGLTHTCNVIMSGGSGIYLAGNKINFDADSNSYIYSPSNDRIDFALAGTTRMFLDGSGLQFSTGVYMLGQPLFLDADYDTYIRAATDDQIDYYLGGTNSIRQTIVGVCSYQYMLGGDNSTGAGPGFFVGRNTNASTPAGGFVALDNLGGTTYYLWVDTAGKLRVGTTQPTNANDTSGTIVGTQT